MGKLLCCFLNLPAGLTAGGYQICWEICVWLWHSLSVCSQQVRFWGSALKCIKSLLEHVIGSCLRKFRDDHSCLVWLYKDSDKSLHFRWCCIFLSLTTQEKVMQAWWCMGSLQCLCLTGKGNTAQVVIKRSKVTNLAPVHQTEGP